MTALERSLAAMDARIAVINECIAVAKAEACHAVARTHRAEALTTDPGDPTGDVRKGEKYGALAVVSRLEELLEEAVSHRKMLTPRASEPTAGIAGAPT